MFDPLSSQLLRAAPNLPELNSDELPQLLTRHYAELVSARLRASGGTETDGIVERWPLQRLADVYEVAASLEQRSELRRAAAFVAGTAQQILSRRPLQGDKTEQRTLITRDSVDPTIAAALLFLASEQYGDANEAANAIKFGNGIRISNALCANIKDLARGRLQEILDRAPSWREKTVTGTVQVRAFKLLLTALNEGIEVLAARMLAVEVPDVTPRRFATPAAAFERVLELASNLDGSDAGLLGGDFRTAYAGPRHLASLLLAASNAIGEAALTRLPVPSGTKDDFWLDWLKFRAINMPFVWPNHREAIAKDFYQTGKSAVLVLPTGAGKTTVSALKIAGTLGRGKKVVFLAPTHALVEQLTEDLQDIFPRDLFGLQVSADVDIAMAGDHQLQDIEVMTPERCLAMLSFSAPAFQNVGLLVFDECHLLSPQSGKIGRALDGMLCLLAFSTLVPDADMLFLSAMLKNSGQFADWIEDLTKKTCVPIDLLWKPSRQARGVVVYDKEEINAAIDSAKRTQRELNIAKGKVAKSLRKPAKDELVATPLVVWGLQHNWLQADSSCTFTRISEGKVKLGDGFEAGDVWARPNANEVAAKIAISAADASLKTIIFVNTKADAISTARTISDTILHTVALNEDEKKIWDMLVDELGDVKHSVFGPALFGAVPHNATMLRLERAISEKLFKRSDGAKVIVATPTLAQGLNLPAHLAILAGDKRSGQKKGTREDLEAHELLNAAARAGRAGHLANGVVILIPEPIVKFDANEELSPALQSKLSSVLPEDDRCVIITDPLEVVLDRVMAGHLIDRDVRYTVNRLAALVASDVDEASGDIVMSRSMGAYLARQRHSEAQYKAKVELLWEQARVALEEQSERSVVLIASQCGLPLSLLERLRMRLIAYAGTLPTTITGWVSWTFAWLSEDVASREHLMLDVGRSALKSAGENADGVVTPAVLQKLLPAVLLWLTGRPLNQIETALGGNPNSASAVERLCPRSREMVATFIPRGLSFIMSVITRMVDELSMYDNQADLDPSDVQALCIAVRKGFDTTDKVNFALQNRGIGGRVFLHNLYQASMDEFDDDDL